MTTTPENLNNLLVYAIKNCNESECNRLIKLGADVNYIKDNYNLIMFAIVNYNNNSFNIIKMLVEAGCNINFSNVNKHTPLIYSIIFYHYDVFEYLLEKGADVNHKNIREKNVLFHLILSTRDKEYISNIKIIKYCNLLIDYGIDILAEDIHGYRAHDYCHKFNKNIKIYEFLKQKEAEREILNQCFKRAHIEADSDDNESDVEEQEPRILSNEIDEK